MQYDLEFQLKFKKQKMSLLAMAGFALAGYSVIANDSVQTLGTWIASNREKFKWYTMWAAASAVMIGTMVYMGD